MYTRTILCLANSKKIGGTCVAGKKLAGKEIGAWIRPVSERATHEISELDRRYQDGTTADVFDVVEIVFRRRTGTRHQSENHLIDAEKFWRKKGTATWKQIQNSLDNVSGPLWLNGYSTRRGIDDKVPESRLDEIPDSLRLVKVSDLSLKVAYEPGWQGKPGTRKVRGSFTLNHQQYRLAVTDPPVESEYLAGPDGDFTIGAAILCLSLSEPIHGYAYKLIATVITKERFGAN